jgi:hypothetical protein
LQVWLVERWDGNPVTASPAEHDLGWFDLPEASRMPLAHGAYPLFDPRRYRPARPLTVRVTPCLGRDAVVCASVLLLKWRRFAPGPVSREGKSSARRSPPHERKRPVSGVLLVAGAVFEPATFGLWGLRLPYSARAPKVA